MERSPTLFCTLPRELREILFMMVRPIDLYQMILASFSLKKTILSVAPDLNLRYWFLYHRAKSEQEFSRAFFSFLLSQEEKEFFFFGSSLFAAFRGEDANFTPGDMDIVTCESHSGFGGQYGHGAPIESDTLVGIIDALKYSDLRMCHLNRPIESWPRSNNPVDIESRIFHRIWVDDQDPNGFPKTYGTFDCSKYYYSGRVQNFNGVDVIGLKSGFTEFDHVKYTSLKFLWSFWDGRGIPQVHPEAARAIQTATSEIDYECFCTTHGRKWVNRAEEGVCKIIFNHVFEKLKPSL